MFPSEALPARREEALPCSHKGLVTAQGVAERIGSLYRSARADNSTRWRSSSLVTSLKKFLRTSSVVASDLFSAKGFEKVPIMETKKISCFLMAHQMCTSAQFSAMHSCRYKLVLRFERFLVLLVGGVLSLFTVFGRVFTVTPLHVPSLSVQPFSTSFPGPIPAHRCVSLRFEQTFKIDTACQYQHF